jgi:hypothetical protein
VRHVRKDFKRDFNILPLCFLSEISAVVQQALVWKTELQSQLANSFALAVTVAHYPTGASKWNPIEHRLFSEVARNWAGEPLDSYQKILNYARTTQTQTGLQVTAYLDRRFYPCGLKPTPDQIASLRLQRHETLPEWNYTIKPQL